MWNGNISTKSFWQLLRTCTGTEQYLMPTMSTLENLSWVSRSRLYIFFSFFWLAWVVEIIKTLLHFLQAANWLRFEKKKRVIHKRYKKQCTFGMILHCKKKPQKIELNQSKSNWQFTAVIEQNTAKQQNGTAKLKTQIWKPKHDSPFLHPVCLRATKMHGKPTSHMWQHHQAFLFSLPQTHPKAHPHPLWHSSPNPFWCLGPTPKRGGHACHRPWTEILQCRCLE